MQVTLKAAKTEPPSKGKKGKGKAKDIDLDDYLQQEPQEEEASAIAAPEPPAQAKGKKGKKQGLSLDDFPEDPDQDASAEVQDEPGQHPLWRSLAAAVCAMDVCLQRLTQDVSWRAATRHGSRTRPRLCMDMALSASHGDLGLKPGAAEPARKPANAKRKGRKADVASAFDALDLQEPAEEPREAPASPADAPLPSSGAGFAALQDDEAVEEATAPDEDSEAGPAGEALAGLQTEQVEAVPAPKVRSQLLGSMLVTCCVKYW